MSLSAPIWKSSLGPLLIRVPLGLYLLIAGYRKFQLPNEFIEVVKGFNFLPEHLAVLYGIVLPYAEMLAGFLLFFGFLTTFAAILSSLILISVIIPFGLVPNDTVVFNKDVVLLAASLSLLCSGAGAASFDDVRTPSKSG